MIATKKKKPKKEIDWKARALRAERVAAAAVEFEYRVHMNQQTYTSREATELSQKRRESAFDDLVWALRDTGTIKR